MKNQTFTAVLNFIEKRLSGKGPVIYQYTPMKQGYLGEVELSKSAKLLRFLIYVYIVVCVVRVSIRKQFWLWHWPRQLLSYLAYK